MEDKQSFQKLANDNNSVLEEARAVIKEARSYLTANGKGHLVRNDKWVTIKRYRELFNLASEDVVNDWIQQGIIKPDDIIDVNVLGGIRLIRAIN